MARKLSPLTAAVILDINSWTAGLKKIQRDQTALANSFKPISKALGDFGKPLLVAGTAISAGLLAMAKSAANFGDQMKDARQRTGLAAEQLSAYKLVADQSGTSFEALTGGLAKLSKTMFEAATKGGQSAQVFKALGIELKDSTGHLKNAGDILPQIADKLSKLEDGTTKTALAQKLFGKSAADLIPFLNEGSAGMAKAEAATRKFGTALSDAEIELGDKFNDSLEETKMAMQGLAVSVGSVLLPPLIKLVQAGNDWIATAGKMARENPGLTKGLAGAGLALVGTGGLLVGLQQVLKIAPVAILAFNDLKAAGQALSLLKGAKTMGDLAAGLELVAGASVAAKVGIFGLIGAMAALSSAVSTFTAKKLFDFLPDPVKLGRDLRSIANNALGLKDTAIEGPPQPKAPGLPANWMALSQKAEAGITDYEKLLASFEKTGKVTKKAEEEIDAWDKSLRQGFDDAVKLSNELQVFSSHQVSASVIMAKYGDEITRAADEFKLWGLDVPPMLAKFASIVEAQEKLAKVTEETTAKFEKEREALREVSEVQVKNGGMTPQIEAIKRQGEFGLRVKAATENLQHQREEVADLSQQILALNRQGLSAKEIEQALGVSLSQVAQRAKELGVQIDPLIRKMGGMVDATENLKRNWKDTFGAMADRLVDFVVDGEKSWKRLADIGKNTFKDLARSFLDGLIKPLKQGLEDLGEHAAQALGNILFGGKAGSTGQQASGGILGGIIGGSAGGGILGGIFGGGGSAATPPFVGPSGAAGGMSLLSGIGGLSGFAEPIGKLLSKFGAGRDSANEIVKQQNAFEQTIKAIFGDSGLSATNKLKMIGNESDIFRSGIGDWIATGGENAVTGNQALATINPWISALKSDLVKQGAMDGGGDGSTYNMTVNVTIDGAQSAETIVDMIKRNVSGITEEMVRQVELRGGSVVSR